jgi:hypothetical protein
MPNLPETKTGADAVRLTLVARQLLAEMRRLTGRDYRIDLAKLNAGELREMQRFLRDAESESQIRARRAQLTPWRRP